jgi:hypothetical protein
MLSMTRLLGFKLELRIFAGVVAVALKQADMQLAS